MRRIALGTTLLALHAAASAAPISILFVGNSYTFGRLDPVLTYNAANVRDLTKPQGPLVVGSTSSTPKFSDVTGTNSYGPGMINPTTGVQGNSFSPHTQTNGWGGVAGIFKQLTVQAGLDYDVALSTRNAATLRGHLINSANSTNWDLRGNISSQSWDKMVLQEQSDEALGPQTVNGVALGSNLPSIRAYVDLIEDWVHTGRVTLAPGAAAVTSYNEQAMYIAQYGSVDACVAAGGTKRPAPTVAVPNPAAGTCDNTTTRNLGGERECPCGDRDLLAADLGPPQPDQRAGCDHHQRSHRQRHLLRPGGAQLLQHARGHDVRDDRRHDERRQLCGR